MGEDPLLQLVRLVVTTQGAEMYGDDTVRRWWCDEGEPPLTQWRLNISSDRQTTSLAVAH